MYPLLFRTVAVRLDPERAHHLAMRAIRTAGHVPGVSHAVRASWGRRPARAMPARRDGGPLDRPVPGVLGLAAGMDKDADTALGMDMLGFGFVEVGTVTAHAQPGNDRPRLWRHVPDRARAGCDLSTHDQRPKLLVNLGGTVVR